MKLNTFFQKQKRKWNRLISLPAMAVALMFGASCNNNDSTTIKSLQIISLAPLGTTKTPVGINLPLQAKATFQDNHIEDVTSIVTWNSSNNTIATVSSELGKQGSVLGKVKGTVKITATTMNDISGTLDIEVSDAILQRIEVSAPTPAKPKGTTQYYTAMGFFSDGSEIPMTSEVTWSSSEPTIASIENGGLATLKSPGTTTISASFQNALSQTITGTTILVVTNANLNSIAITTVPAMITSIPKGFSVQYVATGTYSDGSTQDLTSSVTWTSSDTVSAGVSNTPGNKGLVKGFQADTVTISASLNSISGTEQLQITDAVLVSIQVTSPSLAKPSGLTQQFTATGTFSDGSTQDLTNDPALTWSSSDVPTVTIAATGLASLIKPGTVTISATVDTIVGSTSLVVTDAILTTIDVIPTPISASVPKGVSAQFTAIGHYSDMTTQDITTLVTWSSSQPTIASISNTAGSRGVVTTGAPGMITGTTEIKATKGMISNQINFDVTSAILVSIDVTPGSSTIAKGTKKQLTATGHYSDGTVADITSTVTWTALDVPGPGSAVATFNPMDTKGLATGSAVGQATVTATLGMVSGSATLHVTNASLTAIIVSSAPSVITSIPVGVHVQYVATGVFSDSTTQDISSLVTWSGGGMTASVSNATGSKGLALGTSAGGPVTITATLGAISGGIHLTVTTATLVSIDVTPVGNSIAKGTTQQMMAIGHYSDGSAPDITNTVTWTTVDLVGMGVAGVTMTPGLLSGDNVGQAKVVATLGMVSGSTILNVTNASLSSISVGCLSATTIAMGVNVPCTATGTFSDGSTQDLSSLATWSGGGMTASVSNAPGSKGVVTGVAVGGPVTITATVGTTSGGIDFTVNAATLVSIDVTPVGNSIAKGTTQQMMAIGHYSDGSAPDITNTVTWTTVDLVGMGVAGVTMTPGLLSGDNVGQAKVVATLGMVSGSTILNVTNASLTSLAVTPSMTSIAKGAKVQFTATGTFSDGSTQDLSSLSTWSGGGMTASVSNTAGSKGLATGVAMGGPVTITATVGTTSANASLTVTAATLVKIDITPVGINLPKGLPPQQMTATGTYTDGTTADITNSVTWSSSDAMVATVSNAMGSQGKVTGVAVGRSTITATLGMISGSTPIDITDATLTSIAVTPGSSSAPKGTKVQYTATGTFSDGSTRDLTSMVTWSSSNTMFVTISNTSGTRGLATAGSVSMGGITITATLGAISGTSSLTVTAATLVSIAVTPDGTAIEKGKKQQMTATGTYTDGTTANITSTVTWTKMDVVGTSVISFTMTTGEVKGDNDGRAKVTATSGMISGSTYINVFDP